MQRRNNLGLTEWDICDDRIRKHNSGQIIICEIEYQISVAFCTGNNLRTVCIDMNSQYIENDLSRLFWDSR